MKHIKKFNEYATNEGMFDMFKSDEKIDNEIAEKVQDPENYDIIELGTPDHKSIEDIEEGDVFIDANSAKMRANGKFIGGNWVPQFEESKATWNIYKVINKPTEGITPYKIKYIFKSGKRSNEVVDIPMNECEKWFSHKIKFESGFYRVLKNIGKKFVNPNI